MWKDDQGKIKKKKATRRWSYGGDPLRILEDQFLLDKPVKITAINPEQILKTTT